MATKAKSEAKPADPRGKIVDALMKLAGERRFEDISIREICREAGTTLADFRDSFPSKGAVLAQFSRRIDRAVLAQDSDDLAEESPRERLFDILMRRLEAMAPYREGLREMRAWLKREPSAALAMNQVVLGSMRFMIEAADIELAGGAAGAIKLQGLGLAWARIVAGLAGRRGPGPVEDHGRTRPRADPRRAGRGRSGPVQRYRGAVPCAGAGRLRRPAPRPRSPAARTSGAGKRRFRQPGP